MLRRQDSFSLESGNLAPRAFNWPNTANVARCLQLFGTGVAKERLLRSEIKWNVSGLQPYYHFNYIFNLFITLAFLFLSFGRRSCVTIPGCNARRYEVASVELLLKGTCKLVPFSTSVEFPAVVGFKRGSMRHCKLSNNCHLYAQRVCFVMIILFSS